MSAARPSGKACSPPSPTFPSPPSPAWGSPPASPRSGPAGSRAKGLRAPSSRLEGSIETRAGGSPPSEEDDALAEPVAADRQRLAAPVADEGGAAAHAGRQAGLVALDEE